MSLHLHLDPVGGVAGDMFAAAVLDAWPELADPLIGAFAAAGLAGIATVAREAHRDHALTGSRFAVSAAGVHAHHHRHHDEIRRLLRGAALAAPVCERALAIFALLADAEGRVHGVDPDRVAFHEVGAWDSIADIVAAAWLVEALGSPAWSCAPLPQGSGLVDTAHGRLPVPAPATALLLEGMPLFDDGLGGERVTPTGAAILRHLAPSFTARARPAVLRRTGHGFGTRERPGTSNVLRLLAFDAAASGARAEALELLAFEVDDQSPEDLAVGLDRLRALPGVLDVLQAPVYAKKNRLAVQVQVLVTPEQAHAVCARCFAETTTLGVRRQALTRERLEREALETPGQAVRLKRAQRPGGATVKAEMDDIAAGGHDHAGRERLRRLAEAAAGGGENP